MKSFNVTKNQINSGRRIVMGINVETGEKNKPFLYDPFKKSKNEKTLLKGLKSSVKKSKENKKSGFTLLATNKI